MNKIENIFDLTEKVVPNKAEKVVFFCEVEETAYEIVYYAKMPDGKWKQCYDLADENVIDGLALEEEFDKIAKFIRNSTSFDSLARNVVTVVVDEINENVKVEHFDKSVGLYQIKKEWKSKNL